MRNWERANISTMKDDKNLPKILKIANMIDFNGSNAVLLFC